MTSSLSIQLLLVFITTLLTLLLLLPSPSTAASSSGKYNLPEIYRCGQYYKKCEACVEAGCLYCYTDRKCKSWTKGVLPPPAKCALGDARWSVCWLNFKTLIIAGLMVFCILLVGGSVGVYCLCCRGANKRVRLKFMAEEKKWEKEREEQRARADKRKKERENKAREIRCKYGLDQNGYDRFK